jgi:hypothetical protein
MCNKTTLVYFKALSRNLPSMIDCEQKQGRQDILQADRYWNRDPLECLSSQFNLVCRK